jgi:hypothetical protein
VLQEAHYDTLAGGLLEAMGRLLADNVRIYVHPMDAGTFRRLLAEAGVDPASYIAPETGWVTAETIRLAPPASHLYAYLLAAGWLVPLDPR